MSTSPWYSFFVAWARAASTAPKTTSTLPDYGVAPDFAGIGHWLNTPGGKPLSLAALRGKVVLVDFWTYSCINCLRTLPHLKAWYRLYHKAGLVIVGVHTPEFAFEHELGNVTSAVHRLDVSWPVGLDNEYATWNAYSNQYWPADYLVDRSGHVRAYHFGEGDYARTERQIRSLLGVDRPAARAHVSEPTAATTPETYLGPERLDASRYVGSRLVVGRPHRFAEARTIPQNQFSYSGTWTLAGQAATAGADAEIAVHFHASKVYVVLAGRGRVTAMLGRVGEAAIDVRGARLYTVFAAPRPHDGVLRLRVSPGVRAYSFTFG